MSVAMENFLRGAIGRFFGHHLGKADATKWAQKNLMPSKRPHRLSISGLRAECERSSPRYCPAEPFRQALTDAGITVAGDVVFAEDK